MRAKLPLAAGRGMDRATGLVAAQPQNPVDARNVYARDAKMALRPGMQGTPYPALPWGTDVLCIIPSKATGDVLFCVYDRTSYEIRIFRLRPRSILMQALSTPANGIWGTLSPVATFPVVNAAEADGTIMFAHDESSLVFRLPTIYYTPDFAVPTTPGTLTTLTADLDGTGVSNIVSFRGVVAYLEYMIGWGYGSASDLDRGDIGRLSQPTRPTVFSPENYFIAGAKKDPIRLCIPASSAENAGSILAVGKENEAYRLVGTSPVDFGIELLDSRYGVVSSRAGCNVGGVAYWWSTDGLRRVTPLGTEPIAQPLELISPLPANFPNLGPSRESFMVFDRRRYVLEILFPNLGSAAVRTSGFMLSLWNSQDPRWTFVVREQAIACAGEILLSDDVDVPAPTGYVSAVTGVDNGIAADTNYRSATISWTNNGAVGDEIVQIYARVSGGAWSPVLAVPVGGLSQSVSVSGLLPLYAYEIALKYTRGDSSATGYGGDDPSAWTAVTAAGAKGTFSTTSAAVAWVSGTFSPPSTAVLSWASAQLGSTYLLEKKVGAVFVTVIAGLAAKSYGYPVPVGEIGTTVEFKVTARRGAVVGPNAGSLNVLMSFTVGTPTWLAASWGVADALLLLSWLGASGASSYLLEKTLDGGGTWLPVATVAAQIYAYYPPITELNTTVGFRLTGKFGTYSGTPSATQNNALTITAPTVTLTSISWNELHLNFTGPGPSVVLLHYYSIDGGATWILNWTTATGMASKIGGVLPAVFSWVPGTFASGQTIWVKVGAQVFFPSRASPLQGVDSNILSVVYP